MKRTSLLCLPSLVLPPLPRLPLLVLALLLIAGGCSSSAPTPSGPAIHPLEQNASNALRRRDYDQANIALDAALRHYQSLDDIAGQWRITRYQVNLALASGNRDRATELAASLEFLAGFLPAAEVGYDTQLILGRIRDSAHDMKSAMERALSLARSPLEEAVALTYLERHSEAVERIDPSARDHPGDRAFVFYAHGVAANAADSFEQAHYYYRAAEDSRGIADALASLARLHAQAGERGTAIDYAKRAIIVLKAMGDTDRANALENFMAGLTDENR